MGLALRFFSCLRYSYSNTSSDVRIYRKCYESCPELCDFKRVEAKISSAKLIPSKKVKSYTRYVNKAMSRNKSNWRNMTEDEVQQLILLEMYYENNQARVIERMTRLSIDELISNIGGCVGVWSGISMITVVQVLFYCAKGAVSAFRKRTAIKRM